VTDAKAKANVCLNENLLLWILQHSDAYPIALNIYVCKQFVYGYPFP